MSNKLSVQLQIGDALLYIKGNPEDVDAFFTVTAEKMKTAIAALGREPGMNLNVSMTGQDAPGCWQ